MLATGICASGAWNEGSGARISGCAGAGWLITGCEATGCCARGAAVCVSTRCGSTFGLTPRPGPVMFFRAFNSSSALSCPPIISRTDSLASLLSRGNSTKARCKVVRVFSSSCVTSPDTINNSSAVERNRSDAVLVLTVISDKAVS